MLYKVADIVFSMTPDKITEVRGAKYRYTGSESPLFSVSPKTIDEYNMLDNKKGRTFEQYQYTTCGNSFQHQMYFYNSISLHSSAVAVDDKAYLFSASSGTGKSTHTTNWLKLFGDRAYILNDDKPTIRIKNGEVFAYGTPWSGKHDLSVNKGVKLQGIAFLSRDKYNWIKPMDDFNSFIRLYSGILKRLSPEEADVVMATLKDIIKKVQIWELGCLPDIESARVAFDAMSKANK